MWTASLDENYPATIPRVLEARFTDSDGATASLWLAAFDVAQWQGMIAGVPAGSRAGDWWGLRARSHRNGVPDSDEQLVSRNAGWGMSYRGPLAIKLVDAISEAPGETASIPFGARYPLFFFNATDGKPHSPISADISDPAAYQHDGNWFFNALQGNVRFVLPPGQITIQPGGNGYKNMPEAVPGDSGSIPVAGYYSVGDTEHMFTSSYWPTHVPTGATRTISAVSIYPNPDHNGDPTLYAIDCYLPHRIRIVPHTEGTLEEPGLPLDTGERGDQILPMAANRWHRLLIQAGPEIGATSNGVRLRLNPDRWGTDAPQPGFSFLRRKLDGSGFEALLPGANLLPASEAYQQLVSTSGLELFVMRAASVDRLHRLTLDLLPKASGLDPVETRAIEFLPLDVLGANGNPIGELTVTDMEDSLTPAGDLDLDPPEPPASGGDPDRFQIRMARVPGVRDASVELSTVENPDPAYNDPARAPTILSASTGGGFLSNSHALVSGAVDAEIGTLQVPTPDDPNAVSRHRRTRNIQLGGKLRITRLTLDGVEIPTDIRIPVPVKRTVKIKVTVMTDAAMPDLAAELKSANEIFASTGIRIEMDAPPILHDPPPVTNPANQFPESIVASNNIEDWKRYITGPSTAVIHVFYVIQCQASHGGEQMQGFSIIGRHSGTGGQTAAETGEDNNVFISQLHAPFLVLAHELCHILTNAGHYGNHLDFDYNPDAPTVKGLHNLMVDTSRNRFEKNKITAKKRIYEEQRLMIFPAQP